jgi:GH25 family lysozyme M1 (1,4-beta-N-acetylmuramidase)
MILGCDISEYQGNVDFQRMKDAGAQFVVARKQKGYYGDCRFFEYMDGAKKAGLPFGAYGVPFPGYDITRQYAKFFEGISPATLDFPPFIDVERKHTLTKSQAIADVLAYTYALEIWWGEAVFYTAKYVWQDFYSSKKGWINDWDLWVANYTTAPEPRYIPIGWEYWLDGSKVEPKSASYVMWQFSADGNCRGAEFGASSRDIDLDWMDEEFFNRYAGTEIPIQPYKTELEVPETAEIIELTIRRT